MFKLPDLLFDPEKMKPLFQDTETFKQHHGKHHKKYVDNLNKLIKGTTYEDMSLEDICDKSHGKVYNNAAQHWNHSFYWQCLSEKKQDRTDEFDALHRDFVKEGMNVFGSGWLWIAWRTDVEEIKFYSTKDAATIGHTSGSKYIPLLVADLWEHAYYIEYMSDREAYLEHLWTQFNWEFAEANLKKAKEEQKKWTVSR